MKVKKEMTAKVLIALFALLILTPGLVSAQESEEGAEGTGELDLSTQPYITFDRELVDPPAANEPMTTKVYLQNIGENEATNVRMIIGRGSEGDTLYGDPETSPEYEISNVENAQLESKQSLIYEGSLSPDEEVTVTFDITITANKDKTMPVSLRWEDAEGETYRVMMNQITYFVASAQAMSGKGVTGEEDYSYLGNLKKASDTGGWESPFWPGHKESAKLKLPGFSAVASLIAILGTIFVLRRRES